MKLFISIILGGGLHVALTQTAANLEMYQIADIIAAL